MTEEEKKECNCANCECCKKFIDGLKEFTFKALIIYVGVTLAIITSANILKPKHHYPMMGPIPRFERPMPAPMMHYGNFYKMKDFKGPRGDFRKFHKPHTPGIKPEPKQ